MEMPIPDDWDGESTCQWAVCWPDSLKWKAILYGLIEMPKQGRFWDASTGSIVGTQTSFQPIYNINFSLRRCIMACSDDTALPAMIAALNVLVANSGTSGCCERIGSGGAGDIEPELSEVTEGIPGTDDPPEGFETWGEFFNDKCAVAHNIIDEMQSSLLNVAVLNFGALSLDALGIALTIALTLTIPATVIIAIAGLLLSVGAEIVVTTLLSIINDNEGDLVCELYTGTNASTSASNFHTALGLLIDSGVADPVENYAIKTLARYLVNNQVVNRLYEKDLTKVYPGGQTCGEDCLDNPWEYSDGTNWLPAPFDQSTGLYTLPARTAGGGKWRGDLRITGVCQKITELNFTNFTDDPVGGSNSAYAECATPTTFVALPEPHTVADLPLQIAYYAPWSLTEFEITFKSEDNP